MRGGEADGAGMREVALQRFRKGSADFADGLHVAWATQAGAQPLWAFDNSAAKVIGARLPTQT